MINIKIEISKGLHPNEVKSFIFDMKLIGGDYIVDTINSLDDYHCFTYNLDSFHNSLCKMTTNINLKDLIYDNKVVAHSVTFNVTKKDFYGMVGETTDDYGVVLLEVNDVVYAVECLSVKDTETFNNFVKVVNACLTTNK